MDFFKHENALVADGASVGEGTRVWAFVNILEGAVVGRNCNICDGCFIEGGVRVGNNVIVKNNVALFEGIELEDDVFCGPHAAFINDRYPRSDHKGSWTLEKTLIQKGATVGSNATVLCGVTVGHYAVIGAGSVVTKDVAPYSLVVGNPAKPCGFVCTCGHTLPETLLCQCGCQYRLVENSIQAVTS